VPWPERAVAVHRRTSAPPCGSARDSRRSGRDTRAFDHGLSYAIFDYSNLQVQGGDSITATFTVTNTGRLSDRSG
jgi:hypothetical protein